MSKLKIISNPYKKEIHYQKWQENIGNWADIDCSNCKNSTVSLADNEIENIFRYVMPKSIFVPHSKSHQIAAILCNYKFDAEHGVAVVFENGHFKKIGTQDIVL